MRRSLYLYNEKRRSSSFLALQFALLRYIRPLKERVSRSPAKWRGGEKMKGKKNEGEETGRKESEKKGNFDPLVKANKAFRSCQTKRLREEQ